MLPPPPRDDNDSTAVAAAPHDDASSPEQQEAVLVGPDLNGSKPPLDHKLYRQILLPNGLWCLLVQDTLAMHQTNGTPLSDYADESDEDDGDDGDEDAAGDDEDDDDDEGGGAGGIRDAAAALLVGVGSAYDPPECQGLAHFLEHLLFMGSEKYPGENEYGAYVSKHGGSENAWTEWEYTAYHLDIPQEYLWQALDRLVQHFVSPLLLESAVERELQAIESEFQLNKPSDETRRVQLQSATSVVGSNWSQFGWGNLRSLRDIPARLGVDPLRELRSFFERYYYAANMRLVVMGAYTLDQLQHKVVKELTGLTDIPAFPRRSDHPPLALPLPVQRQHIASWKHVNTQYQSPLQSQGLPWDAARSLGKIFRIVPTKEKHCLTVSWQLPSLNSSSSWKSRPCDFLAHLLGHEGAGSLLSWFRAQQWASGCVAGTEDQEATNAWIFSLSVTLTQQGLQHWTQLVDAIFEYLSLLLRHCGNENGGWPEYVFAELQQMERLSYLYRDEEAPDDAVTSLVEDMAPHLRLPPERLLDGFALLREFDGPLVHQLLRDCLTPQNMRIDLQSSSFGTYESLAEHCAVLLDANSNETIVTNLQVLQESEDGAFADLIRHHKPQLEPNFETLFWCSQVPDSWMEKWNQLLKSPLSLPLQLPQPNPFVPTKTALELKPLPAGDHHALLHATLKVCTTVGKTKQWFPATVQQYDAKHNRILLEFDYDTQWCALDVPKTQLPPEVLIAPDFEGTLDQKQTKFRIVSLALPGGQRLAEEEASNGHSSGPAALPPLPAPLPPNRLPKEIHSSQVLRLWYLQDLKFHRPIAELRLQVICRGANDTPLHRACADLLMALLYDACLETVIYPASLGHLDCHLEATCQGFYFRFYGFDDKLLVLFEAIFKAFLSFRGQEAALPDGTAPDRFDACLEVLRRKYTNAGMYASDCSTNLRLEAIRKGLWSSHQKLRALDGLSIPQFCQTVASLLTGFCTEGLLHGNVSVQESKQAKSLILDLIQPDNPGLKRQKYPPQSMLRIPEGPSPTLLTVPAKNTSESNTSVEVYVQVGKDALRDRVLIDLLVQIMEDPMFNEIRTQDQFGYDVGCDSRWSYGITGFLFHVVSNDHSAASILQRLDQFLRDFRTKTLEPLKDDDFREHVVAVLLDKLDMFNSMPEETASHWDEIVNGRFRWQVWRDEAAELRDNNVTKQDVVNAFDAWLNPDKPRRCMAVQVIGGDATEAVGTGKPNIPSQSSSSSSFGEYADAQVAQFHSSCKNQTWGRVNSKLA